jgi:hypothetical protein
VPSILGIWGQKEINVWDNEVENFRVRIRGFPLLTLGNPPKMLKDDTREYSSTSKPSNDFDKKGLFKIIQEDEEPPLEKKHQYRNELLNKTAR